MGTFQEYNIKNGDITYSQRIQLGEVLQNSIISEIDKFKMCLGILHPRYIVKYTPTEMRYWEKILRGVKYWVKREQIELKYNPTVEEIAAGIENLNKEVGYMGTIIAIAEKFSVDPDTILGWKYGKVYNIIYTNYKNHLYRIRVEREQHKSQERKRKLANRK